MLEGKVERQLWEGEPTFALLFQGLFTLQAIAPDETVLTDRWHVSVDTGDKAFCETSILMTPHLTAAHHQR